MDIPETNICPELNKLSAGSFAEARISLLGIWIEDDKSRETVKSLGRVSGQR